MKNVYAEIKKVSGEYTFNEHCPMVQFRTLTAFTLSRIEQILKGAENFSSEEAWLICQDLSSLADTLMETTGASPQNKVSDLGSPRHRGGDFDEQTELNQDYSDLQCV